MTELRFPSPGLKFYVEGFGLALLAAACVILGVVIVAVDPWNFAGVISMLGGIFFAGTGLVLFLFVWFLYVYGTIRIWRDWKQLRPPAVVISAEGVRYQVPRRPVLVPWPDVEEVIVKRDIFPKKVVSTVYLRLTSDAALLRDGIVRIPASRDLNVGVISDPDVPEERAVRFLGELAGPRLQLSDTDRRPSAGRR